MLPALPLPDARPDPESEGLRVEFQTRGYGTCVALILDENGTRIDEIHEHSFEDAYHAVVNNYPQASWPGEDVA